MDFVRPVEVGGVCFPLPIFFPCTSDLVDGEDDVMCPTKLRGAQRRPMKKEREKFRVARVERKRPRRRRENDLMRRYCCGCGGNQRRVMTARMTGRRALMRVNIRAAEVRY